MAEATQERRPATRSPPATSRAPPVQKSFCTPTISIAVCIAPPPLPPVGRRRKAAAKQPGARSAGGDAGPRRHLHFRAYGSERIPIPGGGRGGAGGVETPQLPPRPL